MGPDGPEVMLVVMFTIPETSTLISIGGVTPGAVILVLVGSGISCIVLLSRLRFTPKSDNPLLILAA